VSVKSYLEEGYLVETLLNFMALTGWSPQAAVTSEGITATNEEIFTLAELIERFSLEAVQAKGAVFNIEKLNWLNREYLKKLSDQELLAYFGAELGEGAHFTEPQLLILAKALTDKTSTKKEALDLLRSAEMAYLFNKPSVTLELIKNSAHVPRLIELLKTIPDADFIPETIKTAIWDFATEAGRGEVLWPMRTSLTGEAKSLDPFTVASLLGKQETVSRLETAARL
jgi:glutamyl-tRNA synthetase